ncbi:intracellular serine protease [Fusarium albosuccineum]|uniref:Intracellular serine protease n=1 Tax=Fusarium albosuccineum TaxID=1237068 RepID=A0A8H4LEY4_9HYPO|nr:intracellular serine protease [Fusarium albosuccineum]
MLDAESISLSSDEGSEDEQPEKLRLATLEEELVRGKWNYTNDEESKNQKTRFFAEHSEAIRDKKKQGENIFHILALLEDRQISKLKAVVYWVVEICGDMLAHRDAQESTGLHLAIQRKNYKMVKYVLEAYNRFPGKKERDLDSILNLDVHGNNSLHLAMREMTPIPQKTIRSVETIMMLIDKASNQTLTKQNNEGFTPLHLAVNGRKCTPQQLDIVKALVKKCEAALGLRGYKDKQTDWSPYQYHRKTYEEWRKKQERGPGDRKMASSTQYIHSRSTKTGTGRAESTAKPTQADVGNPPPQSREKPRGGGDDGNSGFTTAQKANERFQEKPRRGPHLDHKPVSGGTSGQDSNMKKLRRPPTMIGEIQDVNCTSPISQGQQQQQQLLSTVTNTQMTTRQKDSQKPETKLINDKVTSDSADQIARYLKQTYLRKCSRSQALKFLYGGFSNMQVDFNLYGKEGEISEEDFIQGYKCAKLEDTLQFVRIPRLVIKPTPPAGKPDEDAGRQPDDDMGKQSEFPPSCDAAIGRKDLGIIFRWLRTDAEVKKIIKLIVDDSRDPPHCDEEIENAVKPFDVEVWDWLKVDLCCETIAKAAPKARSINLYWSGKNAVLRGWSDPQGGLARLPNLQQVKIFLRSGIEGSRRNLENFNRFKERLEGCAKRKDNIRIHFEDEQNPSQTIPTPRVKSDALQNHRWLKCMVGFSRFINKVPHDRNLQPIKIAIIDDGIDTTDKRLHNRIFGGQYFCAGDEGPSFCVSAGGHGTMMARLVTRVFPQAHIISLKLDEQPQSDGSSQFSVQSAVEAVKFAQKEKVDIINMSWSIEPSEAEKDSLDDLKRAINRADDDNILMFCSANDQGKTEDKSFPGQFSRGLGGKLCKIGAATATGGEYHYVSFNNVDFLFPGRVVEKEQDENAADNAAAMGHKDRSTEGSSLATAFASGLAGLILYILQLVSLYFKGEEVATHYESVKKDPSKMRNIFNRLATDRKFVEVWKVFDDAEKELRTGGRLPEKKFDHLKKICEDMLAGLS